MDKIGDFQYPTLTTFSETIEIAGEALNRFAGLMPNLNVVQKLGYNIKNPGGISGYIYRRFDDMEMFGLFKRERGGIRTTDLAKQALDPYDREAARQGKAKAVRSIAIVDKAFDEWKGEIPDDDAFAARLTQVASVDWTEAKRHSEALKRLMLDCFPYLRESSGLVQPMTAAHGLKGGLSTETAPTELFTTVSQRATGPFGELRTTIGTVVIRNSATLTLARNLLDVLESEMKDQTMRYSSHEKAKGNGSDEDNDSP